MTEERQSLARAKQEALDEARTLQSDFDRIKQGLKAQIDSKELLISNLRNELSLTFMDKVLFSEGSAAITKDGARILDSVSVGLHGLANKRILVVGHTDDLPIARPYRKVFPSNWDLSSARAVAVTRYLQEKGGLPPEDLAAMARAYYEPVAPNDTAENRQKNRRVEIIITNRKTAAELHRP